jgi:S-DNA-T family DNA segregation ATPase FtsK/SpoIIIE
VQIDITVRAPDGERDVRVHGPADATAGELAAAARAAAGLPAGGDDAAAVLRDGAVLSGQAGWQAEGATGAELHLEVTSGRCAGTSIALRPGRLIIGRGPGCDLRLDDPGVSRHHAELRVGAHSLTVLDLGSANGVLLEGRPVGTDAEAVPVGAAVRIGESQLVVRRRDTAARAVTIADGPYLTVAPAQRAADAGMPAPVELPDRVRRSARRLLALAVAGLVPAAGGVVIALVTGSPAFLLVALASPVAMFAGTLGSTGSPRRPGRRAHRRAVRRAAAEVDSALRAETAARRAACPDAAELAQIAELPGVQLWQRSPSTPDFLRLRLGTADLPSYQQVRCGRRTEPAGTLVGVPLVVAPPAGPVGVVGPAAAARACGRWLVAQAAVLHPPSGLRIALFAPADSGWAWARWLPHLLGSVAERQPDARRVLADARFDRGRQTLLVLDAFDGGADAAWLGDDAGRVGDGATAPHATHLVCLAPDAASLPIACHTVVRLDRDGGATLDGGDKPGEFVPDLVSLQWAERVARRLAPLRERTDAPAAATDLLTLVGAAADPAVIARCWQPDRLTLRTTIGIGSAGPVSLDLGSDGPHALIAGTTGAGKSALLRSLVLGLALTHSPADVSFLLVDYKGGAAFASCADLPHVTGMVTDLDPHRTRRALRSLDAEIRRRERLLADAGAADYLGFRLRRTGALLPRLVVVVDEFATLADDLPGFVPGLVDIAQRGRSLGMHLILATQRPGRAVTPDIRANTGVRIALRVTDPAESIDVVGVPTAAAIPAGQPGRGVLSVAGNDPLAFQTALPMPADSRVRAELLAAWRRPAVPTGDDDPLAPDAAMRAVVQCVRRAAQDTATPTPPAAWLPPLPAELAATVPIAAPVDARPPRLAIGLLDLPDRQEQHPLQLDLAAGGALSLCGAPGSGRSDALFTVAMLAAAATSPRQLHIYAVDRNGALAARLAGLPHLATATSVVDPALVVRLLQRLREPAAAARLLLLDDWDASCAESGEVLGAELQTALADLVRTAAAQRLTALVATARPASPSRRGASFTDTLMLRPVDRADFALTGVAVSDIPEQLPPGRGVRCGDGAEFQLVRWDRAGPSPVADIVRRWDGAALDADALRFRPLPASVSLADCGPARGLLRLGLGGDDAATLAVDPAAGPVLLAGAARSGRSAALRVLLAEARRARLDVVVAAPARSPLAERAVRLGLPVVTPEAAAPPVSGHPEHATLLLVDDCEAFDGTPAGEGLTSWLDAAPRQVCAVVAGRAETMATAYRGLAAVARRNRRGVLLQPSPLDGDLLGVRLDRAAPRERRPGRGVAVGLPVGDGIPPDAVAVQVALPEVPADVPAQCPDMWGYR